MEAKTKVQHIPIQTTKEQDENFFARAMNVKIGIIPSARIFVASSL